MKPSVVLAIAAHPDDIDFGAGGTMAAFAADGAAVHYLQLTDGCCGSSDPDANCEEVAALRRDEQRAACKLIGGRSVVFLDHRDGSLEVTQDLKREIVTEIRRLKPDVVITTDPGMLYAVDMGIINHPDHRAAGQAALDAVYPLARDHLSFPELHEQGHEPHNVRTVLLLNFTNHNYYHDISHVFSTKLAAINAHASQVPDVAAYETLFTNMAREAGKKADCEYAEAFLRIDIS